MPASNTARRRRAKSGASATIEAQLLTSPWCTRPHLGDDAVVEVTGLRSPCKHTDGLQPGPLKAVVAAGAGQAVPQRTGVMSVVLRAGVVRPGDRIRVELPAGEHRLLQTV